MVNFGPSPGDHISPGQPQDRLAAWLEDVQLDDADSQDPDYPNDPNITADAISLYRCSLCGNPSAVLRKPSGCEKSRQVGSSDVQDRTLISPSTYCQKAPWTEHKRLCDYWGSTWSYPMNISLVYCSFRFKRALAAMILFISGLRSRTILVYRPVSLVMICPTNPTQGQVCESSTIESSSQRVIFSSAIQAATYCALFVL